ncbi:TPA: hypothetical protein ACH3X1_009784 [Trebouxia sp. C0004]
MNEHFRALCDIDIRSTGVRFQVVWEPWVSSKNIEHAAANATEMDTVKTVSKVVVLKQRKHTLLYASFDSLVVKQDAHTAQKLVCCQARLRHDLLPAVSV